MAECDGENRETAVRRKSVARDKEEGSITDGDSQELCCTQARMDAVNLLSENICMYWEGVRIDS